MNTTASQSDHLIKVLSPEVGGSECPPRCFIIAGPNGAGKTTFAKEFLLQEVKVIHFVNADLIAAGLSPLRPSLVELTAGRLFLSELKRLSKLRVDFAFETTLSGRSYLPLLKQWKIAGYQIEIIYLRLDSTSLSLQRIANRVAQGGHDIPKEAVLRRFSRSWENFLNYYRPLADRWAVYDNSETILQFLDQGPYETK